MAQQTAVERFAEQSEKILIDLAKNNNTFQLELCLHGLNELEVQAKQMEREQIMEAWDDGVLLKIDFIIDYSFRDEKQVYTNGTILVPLYRVLDAISQSGNPYQTSK